METQINNPLGTLGAVIESKQGGVVINFVLIPLLVAAAILLPPVRLVDRVIDGLVGYQVIEDKTGGAIHDPDGTQVTLLPEGMRGDVKLALDPVPRDAFLRGEAGQELVVAAEQFPPALIMKSPLYQINYRGNEPSAVVLEVPIPNEAEPYTTLDLYTWTGEDWEWLPSQQVPGEDVLESKLDRLPTSLVVVQTNPVRPYVSTNIEAGNVIPEDVRDSLVEVNPQGLSLGAGGEIFGQPEGVPEAYDLVPYTVVPTIRNWEGSGVVRSDLIDNLLIDPQVRQRHIDNIVALVVGQNYGGIDIDYRGISPDLKTEFSRFIAQLNEALPSTKRLSVRVDVPVQVAADRWDTGAFDWRTLGRAADVVKIPTPIDPRAYVAGGQMEAMLDWAVGEINRYKIQLLLSTKSLEEVGGVTREISYNEALAPFGNINLAGGTTTVVPGQEVVFNLVGLQGSTGIQYDANTGSYWFAYIDPGGVQRTVFIENASSIAKKLSYVAQYNLRGIAVQNLLTEPNDGKIWEVVRNFLNLIITPVQSDFSVIWTIDQAEGGSEVVRSESSLNNPNLTWQAPEEGGVYEVAALISTDQGQTGSTRGNLQVVVASPTPIPTPTPEPTATPAPTATPTPEPTATPAPQPVAKAQTQSSAPPPSSGPSPNVNHPFDYGIQVDPGNAPAFNIGHIQALGFRWVKFQMPWKDMEPNPGNIQWGRWDEIINAYSGAGIKILLSIPKAPDWARPPDDDKSVEGPPSDPQTYANFVGAVAGRYAGKVQAIEVWNEQNLYYEAGGQGRVNVDNYMALLKASYAAIKAANPNMTVVSGALTPTGAPPPFAIDDVLYLRQMYERGLKGVSDAIGAHPSGFANPPDALFTGGDFDPNRGYDDHRSFFFRNTMEEYRQVMVEFGDGNKTIWPTEFGWPVWRFHGDERFVFAQENTLEEQAQYIRRAYEMGKQWGWVGTMFLWNLDYAVTSPSTELANFGILTGAGPTPAYHALQSLPK